MASGNVTAQEVETAVTSFYRDGGGAVGAAGGGGQQGEVSTSLILTRLFLKMHTTMLKVKLTSGLPRPKCRRQRGLLPSS